VAVALPAGEHKQRAAAGTVAAGFYQLAAGGTERAAVRKNEERKKHDRRPALASISLSRREAVAFANYQIERFKGNG
jgi:hypothetical protein